MGKKLEKIIIKGLFNRFNYSIDLNTGENVAILSAPNGCGKTTIFNMVDCIFSPSPKKLEKILNIPFDECRCVLSNGKTVVLRKKTQNDSDILKVDKRGRKTILDVKRKRYIVGMGISSESREEPELLIYEGDKKLAEVNPENYTPRNLSSILQNMPYSDDYDEQGKMLEEWKYFTYVNRNRREMAYRDFIISLEKYDCDIPINYIQADRLHNSQYDIDYSSRNRSERREKQDPLTEACEEIKVEYYLRLREEYHKRQSEASDSLPKKFLQASKKKVPLERFKQKWNAYIDDIRKFYEIGLLDSDETILTEAELENAYEANNPFLNVYLETFEKTLVPLKEEYDRMKLFIDILNNRNRGTMKKMKYGKDGIKITVDGTPLDINCLSSGEKHDFIMFYNLIFKAEKGSLVLIDEPEISLHITWQEEYLDRLLEICEINNLQAFVATHSPYIVNEHFDLLVERGAGDGIE